MRSRAESFGEGRRRHSLAHLPRSWEGRPKFSLEATVRGHCRAANAAARRSESAARETLPSTPECVRSLPKKISGRSRSPPRLGEGSENALDYREDQLLPDPLEGAFAPGIRSARILAWCGRLQLIFAIVNFIISNLT